MTQILGLPHGWHLYRDCDSPFFRHRDGRVRTPFEFAGQSEARTVFREVKKALDVADVEWRNPGADGAYRAMDKAKLALQLSLMQHGRWTPDLKETGV